MALLKLTPEKLARTPDDWFFDAYKKLNKREKADVVFALAKLGNTERLKVLRVAFIDIRTEQAFYNFTGSCIALSQYLHEIDSIGPKAS